MKKILSTIMVLIFSLGILGQSFAMDIYDTEKIMYTKEIVQYQKDLNKTKIWKEYMAIMDTIVKQFKNDSKKLYDLSEKLSKLDTTLLKDKNLWIAFNYLETKIYLTLIILYDEDKKDIINSNLDSSDEELVNSKVLDLQQKLVKKTEESFNSLKEELKLSNNLTEKWDMKIKILIDDSDFGYLNTNIELNNYEANTQWFDSQITWNLKVLIEEAQDDEKTDVEINSVIDMILKEWVIYALIKEITLKENTDKYKNQTNEEINKIINKLNDFWVKNQYIKYEDPVTVTMLNMLKSADYKKIANDLKTVFDTPLLEWYKKENNKYYLRPTKHTCDSFKKIANIFDPLNWDSCSESQYKSLLEDFNEFWKFYIVVWETDTTIGFEWNIDSFTSENNGYITFTDSAITAFYYSLKPNQEYNPWEWLLIELKDNKINGNLSLNSYEYDYDANEYVDTLIKYDLTGETNQNWEITNIDLVYKWAYDNWKEYLTWRFQLEDKYNFSFFHKSSSQHDANIDIYMNWNLDKENILNDLDFNISIKEREYTWDSDWNLEYKDTFSDIFNAKININNKVIKSTANIFYDWITVAKINMDGNYTKDTFNLDTRAELLNEEISKNIFGFNNIIWEFNIKLDTLNMKNNIYMLMWVIANWKPLFKYEIENNSTIEKWNNKEIIAPEKSINIYDIILDFDTIQ